ncbi:MAG: type II toxin-antitoxin system HicB family antitoxin [Pseudomonadota bacterium]|uniref:type II toxin-antitoxin system HicB family antitoxin n=1 Tax=Fodinicurvata fenggangensis TaxID=1121830 RepID=UPI0006895076|nr:type II toxin-antitoxin system HicB family antitoxin [Fodinicurvata fenggangensis]
MKRYPAFVERSANGEWYCHAPDVPGFGAGADSLDELLNVAPEVLAAHMAALLEAGGTLPEPRSFEALRDDPELSEDFQDAELITSIAWLPLGGKSMRINISLDSLTVSAIDEQAGRLKMSRSAFLSAAARRMIAES